MRYSLFLLTVVLLAVFAQVVQANTINVPGDQPTIQAGIDACVDGDTVMVADGTYTGDGNRDIDFMGKAIVVMSENGPEVTIIDCEASYENQHRGFSFHSGEDSRSVLTGFTIMGGDMVNKGGGIYIDASSPKISNNIITGNEAYSVLSRTAYGGGIYYGSSSTPFLTNNLIYGNRTEAWTDFTKNTVTAYGGGIYCGSTSGYISNNIISGNTSYAYGGFHGTSYAYGGGFYCGTSPGLQISNNTITGNNVSSDGGASGAGIYGSPTITNTIIWGNSGSEIGGSPVVSYSDIGDGGYPGEGNINADPHFSTFHGFDYLLHPSSPCIDSGDPTLEDGFNWPDWYANGLRSDMGAYGGPGNVGWLE
jgi:predicted outer membrane repeat protein